jgi:prepilin-type N-terminal cleavage/methylation domain-containing protein
MKNLFGISKKRTQGFTLVEVLVALVILAITVVGLFSLLAPSSKQLLNTNLRETARNMATAGMEYIKSQSFQDSYDIPEITSNPVYSNFQMDTPLVESMDSPLLQKITITVHYTVQTIGDSPASKPETYILTGYKYKNAN